MAATETKTTGARDVDNYLSRLPDEQRAALEKIRQTIKSFVPDAIEVISYQVPTFKYQDRMLVSYAAFKEHCSFFPKVTDSRHRSNSDPSVLIHSLKIRDS